MHRHIPEDITSLLYFPRRDYVSEPRDRLSLETWVELSGRRWNIQDPTMAHFLDGLLMISPAAGFAGTQPVARFEALSWRTSLAARSGAPAAFSPPSQASIATGSQNRQATG